MKYHLDTAATILAAGLAAFSVWYFIFDLQIPWSAGQAVSMVIAAAFGAFVVDLVRGR